MSLQAFRARFTEFASTADAVIEDALSEASYHHSATELGQLLVTAHLLALQALDASTGDDVASGEVVSLSVAGQSVTYSPQSEQGRDAFYTGTAYGRRYLALLKARVGPSPGAYR